MIFVTVGTTSFPFDRLLKIADKMIINNKTGEELIVQKGQSNYQFKYKKVKAFTELAFDKMIFYLKKARVIITHGGPATIFLALKYGKNLPIIIPRLKEYGEHVDNHQKYFVKFLQKKKWKKTTEKKELIKNLINFTEKLNEQNRFA